MSQKTEKNELLRMTPEQLQEARKLIRKTCANYDDGGNCLLLDDGEPCRCPQLGAYSVICKYFRDAVLPGAPSLYYLIAGIQPKRHCIICGEPIYTGTNRTKYCPTCAPIEEQKKAAERQKRRYRNLTL